MNTTLLLQILRVGHRFNEVEATLRGGILHHNTLWGWKGPYDRIPHWFADWRLLDKYLQSRYPELT